MFWQKHALYSKIKVVEKMCLCLTLFEMSFWHDSNVTNLILKPFWIGTFLPGNDFTKLNTGSYGTALALTWPICGTMHVYSKCDLVYVCMYKALSGEFNRPCKVTCLFIYQCPTCCPGSGDETWLIAFNINAKLTLHYVNWATAVYQ